MNIPDRYRTPLLAVITALMVLLGVVATDLTKPDDPPTSTVPETTTSEPETTTTAAPTTTTVQPTTTVPPTTTTLPDPEGDPFAGVRLSDWLVSGNNEGVTDDSWHPSGNFRMNCEFSRLAYNDPIVYPGQEDVGHLHMYFGNDTVDGSTTYDSLVRDGEGTCPGGPLNRTGYWMPAVFDGDGRVVIPGSFELYYKGENYPSGSVESKAAYVRQIQPYPEGLRMISDAAQWKCNNGNYQSTIPSCSGSLTVQIRFPYCWNGRDLDSADHRSHMAFGVSGTWGECPASHPVHLPELTEFAHWENVGSTNGWSASSDMGGRPGDSFHADWFGGWHPEIQDAWLTNCIHGLRGTSGGNLCDRVNPPFSNDPMRQLRPAPNYTGPNRIPGYTPMAD